MATVKYDVGDILTLYEDGNYYATVVIVRWHTKEVYVDGVVQKRYTEYDLFLKPEWKDNFELLHDVSEYMFFNYKVVGHIDISGMPNDEVKTHLDRAIKMKWYEVRIVPTIEVYWAIMKLCEPKEENEYVKKEFYIPKMTDENCCYDGRDKLEKENRRLKEEIGSQNDKIFELNKEIYRLRNSCTNDRFRIATNLRKIGFTSETIRNIIETDMV